MTTCPACSQPISPNDLACPKCGISLNPGTATAGPAAGGAGKGPSVAAIVVIALVGIVAVVGCLGSAGIFLVRSRAVVRPAPGWIPAGSTVVYEVDDPLEAVPAEMPVEMPAKNTTASP
jgi:hypothetical protein